MRTHLQENVIAIVREINMSPITAGEGVNTRIDSYWMELIDSETSDSVLVDVELTVRQFSPTDFVASWKLGKFEMTSEKFKAASHFASQSIKVDLNSLKSIPKNLYFFTDKALIIENDEEE